MYQKKIPFESFPITDWVMHKCFNPETIKDNACDAFALILMPCSLIIDCICECPRYTAYIHMKNEDSVIIINEPI